MGRALPEITLGRSFARGKAQIVESEILAFDGDEIAELGRRFGRELGDDELREVAQSTEGWAAGVTLAISAPHATISKTSGPRSAAEAYLTKELLSELDRKVVTFLERVAVFDVLDLRVLEASEAFKDARAHLARLKRGGALVSEVAPGYFRLHPVLRELAEARLRKRDAASAAHRDAAQAYAKAGDVAAALFHAAESGDADAAASFLRAHAPAAIATGDRARVRALAASIDESGPDAGVRWYVEGLLEKARAAPNARDIFSRAAAAAESSHDESIAFAALAQVAEHDMGHLARV